MLGKCRAFVVLGDGAEQEYDLKKGRRSGMYMVRSTWNICVAGKELPEVQVAARKSSERRLGRGLESLLGESGAPAAAATSQSGVMEVPVDAIKANRNQPRLGFHEREMSELIASVSEVGILQPLLVRKSGSGYELIAGERRLRAARAAGLASVPVIERDTSDDEMLALALVENLQREDLNPIEKAKGFNRLIEEHNLTQEAAAARIGKDRSTIANFIRLLDLPETVQHIVSRGTISMGHARALLGLAHASAQQGLALRIENEGLSVRETERLVAQQRTTASQKSVRKTKARDPHLRDLEERIRNCLGTKVELDYQDGKGKLTIRFYSDDDFQRFLDALKISE